LRPFAPPTEIALEFYNQGLDLARAGDRDGAEDKMRGAVAANPDFVDAYIVLGKLVAQRGKTSDLVQAITIWNRARDASPTIEQSRRLELCVETATARIRDASHSEESARRSHNLRLVVAGCAIAAVCGVGGYLLRPVARTSGVAPVSVSSQLSGIGSVKTDRAAKDRVAAIRQAINRTDITVGCNGETFVLHGKVQTDAEKRTVLASAAFAAGTQPGKIDGSDLQIAPANAPISAARVEHMLHKFVNRVSTGWDPLRYAQVSVSGGVANKPLKVTGTIRDRRAATEIVQLIKDVYPSANAVDVSGLVVRPYIIRRPVRRWRRRANAGPGIERQTREVVKPPVTSGARPTSHPKTKVDANIELQIATYTVKRGDTIYGITHKYGRETSKWHDLWEANRRAIHRPGSIPSGTKLTLPAGWKAPKSAALESE
jgi:nucleoid-associated protein YgaU